jgi:hypothetical protein
VKQTVKHRDASVHGGGGISCQIPQFFLAQRWKSTITSYLINMDTTPTALEAIAPSPIESIVTLACATSNNNVTLVSMLQAHGV